MKKLITCALLLFSITSFSQTVDLSFGLIKKSGDTITTDIWMDHQLDVRQFNFEIRGIGGDVTLVGLTKGTADASLFSLSFSDASKKVNGINLAGQSVPKGSSMILGVQFLNPLGVNNVCIENPNIGGATVTLGNCADLSTAIIGIEDPNNETNAISVSPNPMVNQTHVMFEGITDMGSLEVYNGLGKLVSSIQNVNPQSGLINIDRNNLTSGIYFVNFVTEKQVLQTKLMVQ